MLQPKSVILVGIANAYANALSLITSTEKTDAALFRKSYTRRYFE